MWGLFVGVGLGFLQVILLRKTAEWMLGSSTGGAMLAVFITIIKLAAIMGILLLLAFTGGITPVLWAAGAMLVIMIALPIILNVRKNRKIKKQEVDK